ncbi:MAG: LysR substrate-binding domain-containing protein [Pseudomonadota bacterium]
MDLNDYYYFVHVVEKGGFAPAGRALGLPKSRLSRHVQQLEDRLGVRLIQRTSRRFVVTDMGEAFYRRARAALDEVEAAEALIEQRAGVLSGKVRLSCSVGMAQFALLQPLSRFMAEHPQVGIIQHVTNQTVDLVEMGIDIAIRGYNGALPDSTLVQRRIAPVPWHLFASYAYLEREGVPATPQALAAHRGLKSGWRPELGHWALQGPQGETVSIPFQPTLCSDDMVTLRQAAMDGHGIVALPAYVCRAAVEKGHLVRVLPQWIAGDAYLAMLMPSRRGVLPAVDALARYLQHAMPAEVAS